VAHLRRSANSFRATPHSRAGLLTLGPSDLPEGRRQKTEKENSRREGGELTGSLPFFS